MSRPKHLVLVVESDLQNLSVYLFLLLTKGYRVVGVRSYEQAKIEIAKHPIEAVFTIGNPAVDFGVPLACGKTVRDALLALILALVKKRGPKKRPIGVPMPPASVRAVHAPS